MKRIVIQAIFVFLLCGCSSGMSYKDAEFRIRFNWPEEEFITPKAALSKDYPKEEVVSLLGKPKSVKALDEYEKWDYDFKEEGKFSLYFEEGRLKMVEREG